MIALGAAPPDWTIERWLGLGGGTPPRLDALRGQVVAIEVFQMLCPGCVLHALPQAVRLHASGEAAVIGLHSVFEHHEAMGEAALAAFLHEFRIPFPVGVDAREPGERVPLTFRAWGLRGTPTLLLLDRWGRVRHVHFGPLEDLALGLLVGRLAAERFPPPAIALGGSGVAEGR